MSWWPFKKKVNGWNGNKESFPLDPEEGDYFDGNTGRWHYSGNTFRWLPTCPCKGCGVELIGFTKCTFRECASCMCERIGVRVKTDYELAGYPKAPKCPPAPDKPITYHCKADSNELVNVTELQHLGMLRQAKKVEEPKPNPWGSHIKGGVIV